MRFGDKQLAALYVAACAVSSQRGVPRGMEGRQKDLDKAILKMSAEITRRTARRNATAMQKAAATHQAECAECHCVVAFGSNGQPLPHDNRNSESCEGAPNVA